MYGDFVFSPNKLCHVFFLALFYTNRNGADILLLYISNFKPTLQVNFQHVHVLFSTKLFLVLLAR